MILNPICLFDLFLYNFSLCYISSHFIDSFHLEFLFICARSLSSVFYYPQHTLYCGGTKESYQSLIRIALYCFFIHNWQTILRTRGSYSCNKHSILKTHCKNLFHRHQKGKGGMFVTTIQLIKWIGEVHHNLTIQIV